jgi:DNA-directed RNA polymerase subunit RPC12/RpoP
MGSQWAPKFQIKYFMFDSLIYRILVLISGWNRTHTNWRYSYVCSTCSVVELKTRFETWITRNGLNGVNLFHLSYLITLTTYMYSQWAPNVQLNYFMFDWSLYILFVLNRGWKRDSLQMMIFVYVCSTCSVVELKTRFMTWIELKGVYTSHIS